MVTDRQMAAAIKTLKQYCEEHDFCRGCTVDCAMLKRGVAPCYWDIPNIPKVAVVTEQKYTREEQGFINKVELEVRYGITVDAKKLKRYKKSIKR